MLLPQRNLLSALVGCVAVLALGCAGSLSPFDDPEGASPADTDGAPVGDARATAPEGDPPTGVTSEAPPSQTSPTQGAEDDAGDAGTPHDTDGTASSSGGQKGSASSKDGSAAADMHAPPGDGSLEPEADSAAGADDAGALPNGKPKPGTK